jgi:hypothetical protein
MKPKGDDMVCRRECKQNTIQRSGIKAIAKMRVINKPQDYM